MPKTDIAPPGYTTVTIYDQSYHLTHSPRELVDRSGGARSTVDHCGWLVLALRMSFRVPGAEDS